MIMTLVLFALMTDSRWKTESCSYNHFPHLEANYQWLSQWLSDSHCRGWEVFSMFGVSLANIFLSPTTYMESSAQSRTKFALLTSLFSLFIKKIYQSIHLPSNFVTLCPSIFGTFPWPKVVRLNYIDFKCLFGLPVLAPHTTSPNDDVWGNQEADETA